MKAVRRWQFLKRQRVAALVIILAWATVLLALPSSALFKPANNAAGQNLLHVPPAHATYDDRCKWSYDEADGGYAPVANEGRRHLAGYVCAAMFRDMSDYVYSFSTLI